MALNGIRLHGKVLGVSGGALRLAGDLTGSLEAADRFCRDEMAGIDAFIAENGLNAPKEDLPAVDWEPTPDSPELELIRAGISTVIYATGFHFDFGWIDLPAFDERGYPRYEPGLYFVGLHWMHCQGSGLFYGVGRDAEYVVRHLIGRSGA